MSTPNIPLVPSEADEAKFEVSDKVLLYGGGGTGKSFSVASTLIDAPEDRRLIYLMTERNAASGFERGLKHYDITPKEGQIIYVFPKAKAKAFTDLNRALANFTKESKVAALKGNATTTQGKEHYTYLQNIMTKLENFTGIDYVTGEEVKIGNVGQLDETDILVIDGLSPIGNEVWKSTAGDKIALSQNDYMPAQNLMYFILSELSKLTCPIILLAHEKAISDADGNVNRIIVNTWVGNANYDTITGLFTDVLHAVKGPTGHKWEISSTVAHTISRKIILDKVKVVEPNFRLHKFFE